MASNNPVPTPGAPGAPGSNPNNRPNPNVPRKPQMSPLAIIVLLVGGFAILYGIVWVLDTVVSNAADALTNASISAFGIPATLVILGVIVLLALLSSKRK